MPAVGGRSVTTFQTVWNRHPAVRYQPGRSSVAVRASTSVSTSLRDNTARRESSCSSRGRRLITLLAYHSRVPSDVLVEVDRPLHRHLVRRRTALEEVGQFLDALQLHEAEGVFGAVHRGEAEAGEALVGDALQVLAHRLGVHAGQTV